MRRIMRTFKMNEISAVDRPAQVHARMAIMKRDVSAPLGGDKPTSHVGEINMDATELKKMIDDAVKAATDPLTATLTTTQADLAKLAAEKAKKPNPFAAGDDEPDADDDTKKAWRSHVEKKVAKAVEAALQTERDEVAKKVAEAAEIAKNDEALVVDGKTLRKSDVGEAAFSIMKGLQEDKEINAFAKRAETEIRMLPGETIAKAKALRAVSILAKEDREVLEKMLKAGSEAMSSVSKSIGSSQPSDGSVDQEIEKGVSAYAAEHKVSRAVAFEKYMATEDGKRLYKRSVDEKPKVAA